MGQGLRIPGLQELRNPRNEESEGLPRTSLRGENHVLSVDECGPGLLLRRCGPAKTEAPAQSPEDLRVHEGRPRLLLLLLRSVGLAPSRPEELCCTSQLGHVFRSRPYSIHGHLALTFAVVSSCGHHYYSFAPDPHGAS